MKHNRSRLALLTLHTNGPTDRLGQLSLFLFGFTDAKQIQKICLHRLKASGIRRFLSNAPNSVGSLDLLFELESLRVVR